MSIVAVIPSRYQSSRFPGKPLALINGKPMIQWVYERVYKTKGLDGIYVATDDRRIFDTVKSFGGQALMTASTHTCGTDRLAECIQLLNLKDDDIILNIQGDEPLIKSEMIYDLIQLFDHDSVYMGTLMKKIDIPIELNNPNVVKIIVDKKGYAIYFSRYALPYEREKNVTTHFKHIGIYAYKKWFLEKFSKMEKTKLESAESLEQLRVIENGYKIRVAETIWQTIGVDTPEQLTLVEEKIKNGE